MKTTLKLASALTAFIMVTQLCVSANNGTEKKKDIPDETVTVTEKVKDKEKNENTKNKVVDKIKKFSAEELEAKISVFKAAQIEAKEYIKYIKANFSEASKDARKKILSEIAKVKDELKDNSIGVFARGFEVDFDKYNGVKPRIQKGKAFVPVRAVVESLDAKVEWDGENRTITITKGDDTIVLTIGSTTIIVNGEEYECDAPPTIDNDTTIVPLRLIAEAFKNKVEWDEDSKTIIIDEATESDDVAEEAVESDVESSDEDSTSDIISEDVTESLDDDAPEEANIAENETEE